MRSITVNMGNSIQNVFQNFKYKLLLFENRKEPSFNAPQEKEVPLGPLSEYPAWMQMQMNYMQQMHQYMQQCQLYAQVGWLVTLRETAFVLSTNCFNLKQCGFHQSAESTGKRQVACILTRLTLSSIILKNGQMYFNNLAVFTPQEFQSIFDRF